VLIDTGQCRHHAREATVGNANARYVVSLGVFSIQPPDHQTLPTHQIGNESGTATGGPGIGARVNIGNSDFEYIPRFRALNVHRAGDGMHSGEVTLQCLWFFTLRRHRAQHISRIARSKQNGLPRSCARGHGNVRMQSIHTAGVFNAIESFTTHYHDVALCCQQPGAERKSVAGLIIVLCYFSSELL
jgi:hypothetical protein